MTMAVEGPQQQAREARQRRGFTLLEMVTAIAASSVILLGMGSAMLVASRAMPDAQNPSAQTVSGAEALEQIATELQYAVSITERSERVIQFTVADRSGDSLPDTIRYEWSGTGGDPLTRKLNSGTAVTVLPNVRTFSLSYDVQNTTTTTPTAGSSGARPGSSSRHPRPGGCPAESCWTRAFSGKASCLCCTSRRR
jgi:prepilin-type N-terminal cleavage/methylation domain-containing protein